MTTTYRFDRPILLKRSPFLSHAILWGLVGVTLFGGIWASVAQIEESVPATGNLAPQGGVRDIKVPVDGVVTAVNVTEGQSVKQGDRLLSIDPTAAQAQLTAQQKIRTALLQENQFYRNVMQDIQDTDVAASTLYLDLPSSLVSLTQNRAALVAEVQLFRAQLQGSTGLNFSPEQQLRLKTAQAEQQSRAATAQLEIGQLEQQYNQNQVKVASTRDNLMVNQRIFHDLETLHKEGGISRVQYFKQQQEVRNQQAQVDQLVQEQERLRLAIDQSQQKLENTLATSTQEILSKIAENEKKIAEIDSQLNKASLENEKKIAEVDSQIAQAKLMLQYQDLRAPVAGIVFDLKATGSGFVTNPNEPVLKIVPENSLIAEVNITNKDIGFIKEGMPVDIRVDSYPLSEFGDIKGELISIGSDALPPTQTRQYYSFPAKVRLNQQFLSTQGRRLTLQSGMSVSVNIKVRQRSVMSIFTEGITKQIESLRSVR
jgi:HlyD family secretion protein